MNNDIRVFYKKTKLDKPVLKKNKNVPITSIKVFHKEYPRLNKVTLPKIKLSGEFMRLLKTRKSIRLFSKENLTLTEISKVLSSCRIVSRKGDFERRTYPSGGDRFPVELYIICFKVKGLENGVFHYNFKNNSLEALLIKNLSNKTDYITSNELKNPSAAIVLTSVMSRDDVKYGVKAYPLSLIEAGLITQNLQLACVKNEIGSCPILGFTNDYLSEILDLTNEEIPLLVIGLGNIKK